MDKRIETEQQSTNPIIETFQSLKEQAKAAFSNLATSTTTTDEPISSTNSWMQPFPDAKGAVIGKENFTKEDAKEDALLLRRAMKGLGTDNATIVEISGHRTFAQRWMIVREYLHIDDTIKKDLLVDFRSDLGSQLANLVLPLYMMPGEFDARLMEKAMRGVGNDVEVLNEVLCTRTNEEIRAMKMAWKERVDTRQSLDDRVSDETKKFFGVTHYHNLCMKLLQARRPGCSEPDSKLVRTDAEDLNRLLLERSNVNTAESKFVEIFTERSWPHIRALVGEFQNVSKKWTLDGALCHEFGESSNTVKALRTIIEFCTDPYDFWAKRLRDAMKGFGTDDTKLVRIVVSRCEIDMANIVQAFGQRYGEGKNLKNWIEQDTSGFFAQLLLNLCGYY